MRVGKHDRVLDRRPLFPALIAIIGRGRDASALCKIDLGKPHRLPGEKQALADCGQLEGGNGVRRHPYRVAEENLHAWAIGKVLTHFTNSEYHSRMAQTITSIEGLVKALGGTTAVADWLGVQPSAVSMWIDRGHIPPGWHLRLFLRCAEKGVTVDLGLFGIGKPAAPQGRKPPDNHRAA